jgi:hypothetical protein
MSGILTGPYFIAYFHAPDRYEIGTMVAILGAPFPPLPPYRANTFPCRDWSLW